MPQTASNSPSNPADASAQPTQNLNVVRVTPLPSAAELERQIPITPASHHAAVEGRQTIQKMLEGGDSRLLVVVGPCSIHDLDAAREYAHRLVQLKHRFADRLYIVMRVYFEKPRTTVGWKGLINDPHLDGSFDMTQGLRLARQLLVDITSLGLPVATEMLDPITPQYIDDLVSWAAIGARTTESQTHRQMASGLSMPVGYKNATDGNLQIAIDAMRSARNPHNFLGVDEAGKTCIVTTRGNPLGHVILRGGDGKPNYQPDIVRDAAQSLRDAQLEPRLMIDCSHANSNKKHELQERVWQSVLDQRRTSETPIFGAMLESNLHPGKQPIPEDKSQLQYGISVTDACIGWEKTTELLAGAYEIESDSQA